ncbi:hypothetical protein EKN07_04075 [Actinobaculum sp. 352]|nr:hypothetical protein EKN07_04075 [Actinobaculum sp. 352]
MELSQQTEIFTGVAAVVAPFLTALFQRAHWSAAVKRWVAITVALILATVTVLVTGVEDPGDILAVAALIIAGSQVIFSAVYPAAWAITDAATPAAEVPEGVLPPEEPVEPTEDGVDLDAVISSALAASELESGEDDV